MPQVKSRLLITTGLLLSTAALATGCGGGGSDTMRATLADDGCTYEGDTTPAPGPFNIEVENKTSHFANFTLSTLPAGTSVEDVQHAVEQGPAIKLRGVGGAKGSSLRPGRNEPPDRLRVPRQIRGRLLGSHLGGRGAIRRAPTPACRLRRSGSTRGSLALFRHPKRSLFRPSREPPPIRRRATSAKGRVAKRPPRVRARGGHPPTQTRDPRRLLLSGVIAQTLSASADCPRRAHPTSKAGCAEPRTTSDTPNSHYQNRHGRPAPLPLPLPTNPHSA